MEPGIVPPSAARRGMMRLAHRWTLDAGAVASTSTVRDYIRPAVRAVPSTMANRLGACALSLAAEAEPGVASRWTLTERGLEVSVAITGLEDHDIAMELLLCLGQALWEKLSDAECQEYGRLLHDETRRGIEGEIDEQALEEKRSLFDSRCHATRVKRLARYAQASFAGTAAEYVHCLWHDVTVRGGPGHLPAPQLRRRLELLRRWFPPDRGYRLFAAAPR